MVVAVLCLLAFGLIFGWPVTLWVIGLAAAAGVVKAVWELRRG